MAESLLHFGATTMRVNGTGVMRQTVIGLDAAKTQTMNTFNMSTTPGKEPTVLCNIVQQRARVVMQTINIDEVMKVNRIILWVKEYGTSYPGGGR